MFEVRGPIGGHFSWTVDDGGPLLLVGGGSGLVPLMSMLRHRAPRASDVEARLLVSARSAEDALYRDELERLEPRARAARRLDLHARRRPPGWTGYARRVDAAMLEEVAPAPADAPAIFVCGPTPFVEAVADLLVDARPRPARHPRRALRPDRRMR